jgi:hypothetical protein
MQRMPQPDSVQGVPHPAGTQQPRGTLAKAHKAIESLGSFQVIDETHADATTPMPAVKHPSLPTTLTGV